MVGIHPCGGALPSFFPPSVVLFFRMRLSPSLGSRDNKPGFPICSVSALFVCKGLADKFFLLWPGQLSTTENFGLSPPNPFFPALRSRHFYPVRPASSFSVVAFCFFFAPTAPLTKFTLDFPGEKTALPRSFSLGSLVLFFTSHQPPPHSTPPI